MGETASDHSANRACSTPAETSPAQHPRPGARRPLRDTRGHRPIVRSFGPAPQTPIDPPHIRGSPAPFRLRANHSSLLAPERGPNTNIDDVWTQAAREKFRNAFLT